MRHGKISSLMAVALVVVACHASLQAGQRVIPKTTVVHVDENAPATLLDFMAAIPANIFHRDGERYQGVLVTDDVSSPTNKWLLDDWSSYLAASGAGQSLVFVGDVPEATRRGIAAALKCAPSSFFEGSDPAAIARRIARDNWSSSPQVVLAPAVVDANDTDIRNAANAAVYASAIDSPLLYANQGKLDEATFQLARSLGAKGCVVFDLGNRMDAGVAAVLSSGGMAITLSVKTEKAAIGNMFRTSGRSTICFSENRLKSLAAAVACACYEGTVAQVPPGITALSVKASKSIDPRLLGERKLERVFHEGPAEDTDETAIADAFYKWLSEGDGEDPNGLETVIVFAGGGVSSGVPLTLERSLIGDPRRATDRGCIASRMPGSWVEDIAYINRTSLYRALVFSNPRRDRITAEMVAYEVQFPGGGISGPTVANDGKEHIVNEFFGCNEHGYGDPGVLSTFKDRGYHVAFHSGREADMNVEDPVNHEKAWGMWKDIKDGTAFSYYSGHGSTEACYNLDVDNGIKADQQFGTPHWPSKLGRVNHSGPGYAAAQWDADYDNIHSAGLAFNACLMGGGSVNNILLKHGAAFVMTNYVSGSFDGGGYAFCTFADELSKDGRTVGEAHAMALSAISEVFAAHRDGRDRSIRFALFGDCRMEFVKPGWTRPIPVGGVRAVGGHKL